MFELSEEKVNSIESSTELTKSLEDEVRVENRRLFESWQPFYELADRMRKESVTDFDLYNTKLNIEEYHKVIFSHKGLFVYLEFEMFSETSFRKIFKKSKITFRSLFRGEQITLPRPLLKGEQVQVMICSDPNSPWKTSYEFLNDKL